ncbi:curli production assembly/transport protein CsgE, partial [Klebsiella pneumoniae]
SAQIREILINESAWEEMTCLFALSLISLHKAIDGLIVVYNGYGNKYEDE